MLNYQNTSEKYLYKQLSKTKRIAESPTFKEFEEFKNVSTEGPKSAAESNILGRLFKSTPVKNILPTILGEIRALLGISDVPPGKQTKSTSQTDAPKSKSTSKQQDVSGSDSGDEDDAQQQPLRRGAVAQGSDDDVSDDDLAEFDGRLAPGSDSEEESGSDEDETHLAKRAIGSDDISDSVSRSPSPAFSTENSPPPKKTKASKGSSEPAQKTTFLPSLMMGGYWSGSESEATDDEQVAGPPKRKNRMGQQARRALWEKKYGEKANHVQQEQKKQRRSRDSGWDTRRGATGGGRGGHYGGRGGYDGSSGRPHNRHDGQDKPKAPPKETSGPLHPSWEAKRKQKEQSSNVAFQGTKVTFD